MSKQENQQNELGEMVLCQATEFSQIKVNNETGIHVEFVCERCGATYLLNAPKTCIGKLVFLCAWANILRLPISQILQYDMELAMTIPGVMVVGWFSLEKNQFVEIVSKQGLTYGMWVDTVNSISNGRQNEFGYNC